MYLMPLRARSTGPSRHPISRPLFSSSTPIGSPQRAKTPMRASFQPMRSASTSRAATGRRESVSPARSGFTPRTAAPSSSSVKKKPRVTRASRVFNTVPQRGFFAPSKCASLVIAFAGVHETEHVPASDVPCFNKGEIDPPTLVLPDGGEASSIGSRGENLQEQGAPCYSGRGLSESQPRTPRRAATPTSGFGSSSPKIKGPSAMAVRGDHSMLSSLAATNALKSCRGKMYVQEEENFQLGIGECVSFGMRRSLWVGSADGSIEIRCAANPSIVLDVIPKPNEKKEIVVTALVQAGHHNVVAGDSTGALRVYHACTGELLETKQAHSQGITCMTRVLMPTDCSSEVGSKEELFYPTAAVLLTGSLDGTVAKWDGITLECLGRLSGSKRAVTALVCSKNGRFAFSGCEGGIIRFWNLIDNQEIKLTASERHAVQAARVKAESGDLSFGSKPLLLNGALGEESVREVSSGSAQDGRRAKNVPFGSSPQASPKTPSAGLSQSVPRLRPPGLAARDSSDFMVTHLASPESSTQASPTRTTRIQQAAPSSNTYLTPAAASTKLSSFSSISRTRRLSVSPGTPLTPQKKSVSRLTPEESSSLMERLKNVVAHYESGARNSGSKSFGSPKTNSASASDDITKLALNFEFPLLVFHQSLITSLEVVEDRWLVSCSKDGTAQVFALPTGQHLKSLRLGGQRRPLSKVLYDAPTSRLYVFSSEGDVTGFSTSSAEMEVVVKLTTSLPTPGCTFSDISLHTLHRFLVLSEVLSEADVSGKGSKALEAGCKQLEVSVLAQVDRNPNISRKPNTKNKVQPGWKLGAISAKELELSQTAHQLQQTCQENHRLLYSVRHRGSLDDMEFEDLKKCGHTFTRWQMRRLMSTHFLKWQRWEAQREVVKASRRLVNRMACGFNQTLQRRYWSMWFEKLQRQARDNANALVCHLSTRPSRIEGEYRGRGERYYREVAAPRTAERQRQVIQHLANTVDRLRQVQAFSKWMWFAKHQREVEEQEIAFNRLLLSFNKTVHCPTTIVLNTLKEKSLQYASQDRSLSLLHYRTQERERQQLFLRYFKKWLKAYRCSKEKIYDSGWLIVRLYRPREIRSRYFFKWLRFCQLFKPEERLRQESTVLKHEWLTLQNVLENPVSVEELQEEITAQEKNLVKLSYEKEAIEALRGREEQSLSSLRIRDTLLTFLDGFDPLEDQRLVLEQVTPRPSPASSPHRSFQDVQRRTWSVFKALGGVEENAESELSLSDLSKAQDSVELRRGLFSLLRGLKACVLHCGRDFTKISSAYSSTASLKLRDTNVDSGSRGLYTGSIRKTDADGGLFSTGARKGSTFDTSIFSTIFDAFNGIASELISVIYAAGREAGIDPSNQQQLFGAAIRRNGAEEPPDVQRGPDLSKPSTCSAAGGSTSSVPIRIDVSLLSGATEKEYSQSSLSSHSQTPRKGGSSVAFISWLQFATLRTRQEVMELISHLLMLFDCFSSYSEKMLVESNNTQFLPLSSLCSLHTAALLIRHAPIFFELLSPQIWESQLRLSEYAAENTHFHSEYLLRSSATDEIASGEGYSDLIAVHPRENSTAGGLYTPSRFSSCPGTPLHPTNFSTSIGGVSGQQLFLPSRAVFTPERQAANSLTHLADTTISPLPSVGVGGRPRSPGLSTPGLHSRSYACSVEDDDARSFRSFNSTPRAISIGGLHQGGSQVYQKPFLGFRVQVSRDAGSSRSAISIKEITPYYTNLAGEKAVGPAALAGLQVGDQFVRFAHYAVTDLAAFNAVVARHVRPGAQLPVVVLRNGETISTQLKVAVRMS